MERLRGSRPTTTGASVAVPISAVPPGATASGGADPCAELGTRASVLNSAMNCWAIGSKMLAGTSVRAGIDPFLGLKGAWPSCEPQALIQLIALARLGAPLGRPKVSHTITYLPVVPGEGAAPKSLFGTQFAAVK